MLITKFSRVLSGALVVVSLAAANSSMNGWSPSARAQSQDVPIRLKPFTFDPIAQTPDLSKLPSALRVASEGKAGQPATYLLQFGGPVTDDWKAEVQRLGVRLYGYVPEHAFIARIDPATLTSIRALPFVRWVGPYAPAYRIAPELTAQQANTTAANADASTTLSVQALPDADLGALEAAFVQLGGTIEATSATTLARYLRVRLPVGQTNALAATDGVVWVEPDLPVKAFNDTAAKILRVAEARQTFSLFGAGQIVAVADTGLDTGNADTLSPDVKGRIAKTYCLGRPTPCDWSDPNGHGTHVSGSVLGNGSASGSAPANHQYSASYAGMAPEAKLVIQSIGDGQGGLGGIPNDDGDLMRQAYADGARIHTNSWGGVTGNTPATQYGGYVKSSQNVDLVAWEHKDMLILFAAGNEGADSDKNGVIDPDSVGQPGTAKNVLTVGASENERPSIDSVWSSGWGFAAPILNTKKADNKNGMAPFSSRGPTDDGRIKPDVVAPGTQIISLRSQKNAFESTVESNASSFTQALLNGGTSPWQTVADAHSAPQAWTQKASGSKTAKAMTALFTPRLNLAAIGDAAVLRIWHKYRLTGDNALAFVFTDGTKTLWLTSSRTGTKTAYDADSITLPLGQLAQNGINLQSVSLGFALYSATGSYDSEWFVDDIRLGPFVGSMSSAGVVPATDPKDNAYGLDDGTSMATPLTAGSMAVLREWFVKNGTANPSSALLKAAVMNGAANMSPGQYGTGPTQEIPATRPNNVTGWGRVDVLNTISPAQPSLNFFKDGTSGLKTGETAQITFTIGTAATVANAEVAPSAGSSEPMLPGIVTAVQPGAIAPHGFITTDATTAQISPNAVQAPQAVDQLIQNGGFEQNTDWHANGDTFVYCTCIVHNGIRAAHSKAGYDSSMWQFVTIPADALTATVKFYWRNINPDVGYDQLRVTVYDESLQTLLGSADALNSYDTTWQYESSDFTDTFLASLRGKTVAIRFEVSQDSLTPDATFYVDDVSLNVGRGTSTATPTPVTPTPSGTPATPQPTVSVTAQPTSTLPVQPTATPTATTSPGQPVGPVAITLAWTDYPGEPAAAKALVNDLDLEVVGPDGTHYYGNQGVYAAGSPCLRENKYDACNNVETVTIANAKAGSYQIIVRGAQVAQGGTQPYAIAASGPSIKSSAGTTQGPSIPSGLNNKVHLPVVAR